ncbi:MAG TPA: signal peptide peptidase SppA [Thermoanaerobaculia bacterium]|jgi:protease-4|nr:signal peptide peptidase SppA [Thermoanaerobaculia bacterium]
MKKLLLIFVALLGIAVLATVAGILMSRHGRRATGDGATVLVWKVDGPVLEQEVPRLPFSGGGEPDSIAQLYPAFRAAREDPGIKGLAVYVQDAELGLAKAQELRRQMMALRRAGKFVECYLETAGEGSNGTLAYYLATACERIHLSPAGDLNLLGLSWESRLLRGTLDKLKIDPQFNRVGRYKSAVETYTQSRLTPEAQEAIAALLDGYYSQIVSAVAEARRKSETEVRELIDGAPYDAETARKRGLVDDLAYPDEFLDHLRQRLGRKPALLPIEEYRPEPVFAARQVAVVFALGTIVRGGGGTAPWTEESYLGSDKMAEVLRDLREDGSVAAVVLRIDSPGGSALASDLILRQVERLKQKKPVVVSMSDTAASGGYYIAARASKIVAEPATLTGSIGVFGGKFVTRRFEEEVLGIGHDSQKRGANADLYSELQPYSPRQEALVQQLMDRTYAAFVGHVAAGRRMSRQAVEGVASGRVWIGAEARRIGLVDELGGLDRALELARTEAGIGPRETVAVDFYPAPPTWLEVFLAKREPRLPGALVAVVKGLETHPPRLLELPPELVRLSRPF